MGRMHAPGKGICKVLGSGSTCLLCTPMDQYGKTGERLILLPTTVATSICKVASPLVLSASARLENALM